LPSNPKSQQASRGAKCAKVLRAAQSVGRQTVSHIKRKSCCCWSWRKRVSMETGVRGAAAAAAGELLDLVPLVGLGLFLTPPPDLIVRCSQHDTTARAPLVTEAALLTHAAAEQARRHHDNYRSASTYEHQRCLIFSCASPTDFCPGRFLLPLQELPPSQDTFCFLLSP
jgi:hypothetical protein